jgi:glutamate dehydrogenase
MRDDLYSTITDMTLAIMKSTEADLDADARMQTWVMANSESIQRAKKMFEEINQLEHDDMASLSVALRLMRSTVRS